LKLEDFTGSISTAGCSFSEKLQQQLTEAPGVSPEVRRAGSTTSPHMEAFARKQIDGLKTPLHNPLSRIRQLRRIEIDYSEISGPPLLKLEP
jgi:hypothetical protein